MSNPNSGAEMGRLRDLHISALSDAPIPAAGGSGVFPHRGRTARGGNAVRLLKDGCENYPGWLDAIRSAQHWIHFETYILHEDKIGKVFAEALCERARAGVKVRLLIDWLGNMMKTSPKFWRTLRQAGVEARSFGYPTIDSPLGWVSRDHRKSLDHRRPRGVRQRVVRR